MHTASFPFLRTSFLQLKWKRIANFTQPKMSPSNSVWGPERVNRINLTRQRLWFSIEKFVRFRLLSWWNFPFSEYLTIKLRCGRGSRKPFLTFFHQSPASHQILFFVNYRENVFEVAPALTYLSRRVRLRVYFVYHWDLPFCASTFNFAARETAALLKTKLINSCERCISANLKWVLVLAEMRVPEARLRTTTDLQPMCQVWTVK